MIARATGFAARLATCPISSRVETSAANTIGWSCCIALVPRRLAAQVLLAVAAAMTMDQFRWTRCSRKSWMAVNR